MSYYPGADGCCGYASDNGWAAACGNIAWIQNREAVVRMAGIAKVATTIRLGDPDPDGGFWLSRPPAERVAHVLELQGYFYGPSGNGRGQMGLSKDLHDFLLLCVRRGVRLLAVGGYALAAHGHPRPTKHLDVWIRLDPGNAARVAAVLEGFGFGSLGLAAADFTAEGQVVQLGHPPNRIDILTGLDGGDFEACWERRAEIVLDSLAVPFIGFDDPVGNKLAAGRLHDRADVEALRRNCAPAPGSAGANGPTEVG